MKSPKKPDLTKQNCANARVRVRVKEKKNKY